MNDDIYKVMWNSFHEQFYVDITEKKQNKEYLNALTQIALDRFTNNQSDYVRIADYITFYDNEIKSMFSENNLIFIKELVNTGDIPFDEIYEKNIEYLRIDYDSTTLQALYYLTDIRIIQALRVLNRIDSIKASDKRKITQGIETLIKTETVKGKHYSVSKLNNNWERDLFYQIAIKYCCKNQQAFRFNYQTKHSIYLYEQYNRNNMFYDIYRNVPALKKIDYSPNEGLSIISKVLHSSYFTFSHKDEFWVDIQNSLETTSSDTISCFLATLFNDKSTEIENIKKHQSLIDNSLFSKLESNKRENSLLDKICYLENRIDNLQTENAKLEKEILGLQTQIAITEAEKKELYSLREYVFSESEKNNNPPILPEILNDVKSYEDLVIVGGHPKWVQKVKNKFSGISFISIDQNVIDLEFLKNKRIIIFVISYISHSLYKRIMSAVENQKLGYIQAKNLEKLEQILDEYYDV